jgi:hypothetical protein
MEEAAFQGFYKSGIREADTIAKWAFSPDLSVIP